MGNEPSRNDRQAEDKAEGAQEAGEVLARQGRPFLALFSSAAAVSTFLLFAGFLSDYGVHQLLGLPRLSFSLTALIEAGADTLIDTLALLFQGMRLAVLLGGLALLALLWAHHEHPRLRPWARCRHLHSLAWLLIFVFSLMLLAAQVDRAQRSLRGDMHTPQSVARALQRAYEQGFPTPEARRYELEREGFNLRFYALPVWMLGLEHLLGDAKDDALTGIELRVLPKSRADARHVYGWLTLSVILLLLSLLVLRWWLQHLEDMERVAAAADANGAQPVEQDLPAWMRWWVRQRLGREMEPVIQRLLQPLVWLMLAASVLMLPLLHGVLARQSLGGQTMMVYLKPDGPGKKEKAKLVNRESDKGGKEYSKETESEEQNVEPTKLPTAEARFDCKQEMLAKVEKAAERWQEALRDALQARWDEGVAQEMASAISGLADAVLKANCAEALHTFWAAKPAPGLLTQSGALAQLFRQAQMRVNSAYQVRQGVILAYPRDGQPLMLVENVVPRTDLQPGQWSVWSIPQEQVLETAVIPDVLERTAGEAAQKLRLAPDESSELKKLLTRMHPAGLRALLPLLEESKLNANATGVAITAFGGMVRASALGSPAAARQGIEWLTRAAAPSDDATSGLPSWQRSQGGAVTALHLSDDPYAAARFSQLLRPPFRMSECRTTAASRPLHCVPQSTTTAGYLLAALSRERQLMPALAAAQAMPRAFNEVELQLQSLLAAYIDDAASPENWRGAACSIVEKVAGALVLNQDQAQRFLASLAKDQLASHAFSVGACLSASKRLGLPTPALRQALRELALMTEAKDLQPRDLRRFRLVALMTLFEMGLSAEQPLLRQLIEQDPADERVLEATFHFLSEADGEAMAQELLQCASNPARTVKQRRRCMQAFAALEASYSGDDGGAQAVLKWTQEQAAGPLKEAGCQALGALLKRESKFLARMQGDEPTLDQCLASEEGGASGDRKHRMKQLLELLSRGGQEAD